MAEAADRVDTLLLGWGHFIFRPVLSSAGSTKPLTVVLAALEGHHVVPYMIINGAAVVAIAIPAVLVFLLTRGGPNARVPR
jgi:ABC-type glycerol-3-phosphate transport system permease component